MNRSRPPRWGWSLTWAFMTVVCLGFAFTTAEFYWVTINHQTPTYAWILAWAVSDEFAYGPDSGFAQMTPYWRNMPALNQVVLGVHALLASIALVIGGLQFHPKTRTRWPRWHRIGGRIYATTTLVAMLLAMVYLLMTPTAHIYGGAPFAVGLWGIAILTTYTLMASWIHIIRGERVAHQTTMVLNFAAMLIAPLLRFWWMALGWLFQDAQWTQATAHVAVLMFLGVQVVVGAIVVLYVRQHTLGGTDSATIVRFRQWASAHADRWEHLSWVALAIAAVVTTHHITWVRQLSPELFSTHGAYFILQGVGLCGLGLWMPFWVQHTFGQNRRPSPRLELGIAMAIVSLCVGWSGQAIGYGTNGVAGVGSASFLFTMAAAMGTLGTVWAHAHWRQDHRAVREMTLHLYALAAVSVTQPLLAMGFASAGMSWASAYLSAAVLLPPLHLSFSFYYTVYSDRNERTAPVSRATVHSPSLTPVVRP